MKNQIFFSIIIPVRTTTPYLKETLSKLKKQTFKSFEVLVITDEISKKYGISEHTGPSFKRNLGAKIAKGKYLAFLDDDSYPSPNWLKNAFRVIKKHPIVSGVCGPCLTPPHDNAFQKASGLVWSSWIGSGGAGVYRNSIKSKRNVDDYPTVNLIINKNDFMKIKGFDNSFWPGEDTILCLKITKDLKKKIIYHPTIKVYHHRRSVLIPHLQQITRYAIHRGHFAKKFPQTSLKIGYLVPSIFCVYLFILILTSLFGFSTQFKNILILPLYFYISILICSYFVFVYKKNSILTSLLATIAIPVTHIYYGILFVYGLSKKELQFQPHQINEKENKYIGG